MASKRWTECFVATLMIGVSPAALAQTAPGTQDAPAQDGGTGQAPAAEGAPAEVAGEEIIVRGTLRGSVVGDIEPEQTLDQGDVRAFGVSSIAELLEQLAPQISSARGRGGERPVLLLNGRRISGFRELRDIPTEAIERVEILPEEVALKYGYRADQRVVNFVLRERFRSITGEIEGGAPTAGGFAKAEAEVGILRLTPDGRVNLNVEYEARGALLESERDIIPTTRTGLFDTVGNVSAAPGASEIDPALSALAGVPVSVAGVPVSAAAGAPLLADFGATAGVANANGVTRYRTLQGDSERLQINGVYAFSLGEQTSATLNAELEASSGTSLFGLPSATVTLPAANPFSPFSGPVQLSRYYDGLLPLSRTSQSRTGHLGFSANGSYFDNWIWAVTGNYDYSTTDTFTDTGISAAPLQAALDAGDPLFNPFGPLPDRLVTSNAVDTAQSTSSIGTLDLQTAGVLFSLPAGDFRPSLRLGGRTADFESRSFRAGARQFGTVSRDVVEGQANIDIPIASRRTGFLDAIGDFTLNGNIEVEELSDFGTLVTYGYGFNWEPVADLRFLVSVTEEEGAPTPQQLGDPTIVTPNVAVFDYTRGETVEVTSVSGGNPGLIADDRTVLKIGGNYRFSSDPDLRFSADYVRSTIRNDISGLPAATAEIEAAFPDRFLRDGEGRLIRVDNRAVNFARTVREELRYGINFSASLPSSVEREIARYREAREAAVAEGRTPPEPPESLRAMRDIAQQRRGERGARPGAGRQPNQAGQQGEGQQGQQQGDGQQGEGQQGQQGERRARAGGGRGPGGGGFRGMGGRNGPGAGRVYASLYHTIHLRDEVLIREGLPVLDRLDGSATGSRGGQPRHQVEFQGGVFKDGFGARANLNWQSGTEVNGGTIGNPDRLRFSSLATVNLRLFADLGQQLSLVRDHPFFANTRVSLDFDNVFDSRQRVTDSSGSVPLSYQPDLIDPVGRSFEISFRKLFY